MRKDFSPHAVSGWMTDQEAETLIKAILISRGGMGPVVVLAEPSMQPIPKGETSSPGSWPEYAKRVARMSH
jgi:hypothetical protein